MQTPRSHPRPTESESHPRPTESESQHRREGAECKLAMPFLTLSDSDTELSLRPGASPEEHSLTVLQDRMVTSRGQKSPALRLQQPAS